MAIAGTGTTVVIEGRTLGLSNLDKNLYPDAPGGFTKSQIIDYYVRIAPVMLPHLAGRACTMVRFPDGVNNKSFFAKNLPSHAPDWFDRVLRKDVSYGIINELAALVWAANMAAIELHVPMHRDGNGPGGSPSSTPIPDRIVFDLDPGPQTDVRECSIVAQHIKELITPLGFVIAAKTSGSKGLQLYATPPAPMEYGGDGGTTAFAKQVAEGLERAHPSLIVSRMTKELRTGKVLIDWSQNVPAKTTVAVYSLRAKADPTVSTPVTWNEIDAAADGSPLRFTAADVLERVAQHGDLFGAPWAKPTPGNPT